MNADYTYGKNHVQPRQLVQLEDDRDPTRIGFLFMVTIEDETAHVQWSPACGLRSTQWPADWLVPVMSQDDLFDTLTAKLTATPPPDAGTAGG